MNFRAESKPQDRPFTPQGAPRRTLWPHVTVFFAPLMGVWAISYLVDETLGRPMAVLAAVALFGALCWYIKSGFDYYERTGWYEHKPAVIPTLPLVISKWANFSFNETEISVGRKERVPYSTISEVKVHCKGVHFSHIEILSTDSKPIYVSVMSNDGEPARAVLTILQQKAPHAKFEGPKWIEQGWVPRLGFTISDRSG